VFDQELTVNRLTGEHIQADPGRDTEKGFQDTDCPLGGISSWKIFEIVVFGNEISFILRQS